MDHGPHIVQTHDYAIDNQGFYALCQAASVELRIRLETSSVHASHTSLYDVKRPKYDVCQVRNR